MEADVSGYTNRVSSGEYGIYTRSDRSDVREKNGDPIERVTTVNEEEVTISVGTQSS
jgi:hypothetical protein